MSTPASRARALAFSIPGKSAKELEQWVKTYRYDDWERVKGTKDRYTYVQIVEAAQKEMREEDGDGDGDEEDEKEETGKGKRKSRVSIGYEGGQHPAPASPRVKPAAAASSSSSTTASARKSVAGAKRKSRGRTEEDEEEDEDGADTKAKGAMKDDDNDDDEEDVSETHVKKKPRMTRASSRPTPAPTAASATKPSAASRKKSTTKTTAKGTATRKSSAASKMDDDEEEDQDEEMADEEEEAPAKPRSSTAAASTTSSTPKKPAATPFLDDSLFSRMGTAPAQKSDDDVDMLKPSPEPTKVPVTFAPLPAQPNPFQRSPTKDDSTSSTTTVSSKRHSTGPSLAAAGIGVPTPFAQAHFETKARAKSLAPSSSPTWKPSPSAPIHHSPRPRTPSPPRALTPTQEIPSDDEPVDALPPTQVLDQDLDEYASQFSVPAYIPGRRTSSTSNLANVDSLYGSLSPQETELRRRFSVPNNSHQQQQHAPAVESKYPYRPSPIEEDVYQHQLQSHHLPLRQDSTVDDGEEEQKGSARTTRPRNRDRRYSDRVTGLGVEEEMQPAAAPPPSLGKRLHDYMKSMMHFLLRTLIIGLMIGTIILLIQDGRLWRAIVGQPGSTTVFCPSDPEERLPLASQLPKGQIECRPCPLNGYCTQGMLDCVPHDTYAREGDICVLNNEAHRGAHRIKEAAIDILERRRGDYECGYLLPKQDDTMDRLDLKRAVASETTDDIPSNSFEAWWHEGMLLFEKESNPREAPGVRVLVSPTTGRELPRLQAVKPQYSIWCQITNLLRQWSLYIISISLFLSIFSQYSYAYFLIRRLRLRRIGVESQLEVIRTRLQENNDVDYNTYQVVFRPLAIAHLREEYLQANPRADPQIWVEVCQALAKDSRIEKAKQRFGSVDRDSWCWTGPLPLQKH